MKVFKSFLCVPVVVFVTACVGTNTAVTKEFSVQDSHSFSYEIIDNARVTEQGMSIFKTRLDSKLKQADLYADDSNLLIEITLTDYRMRHGATRALVGIMAGADSIISTILIKDKITKEVVGSLKVVSKNPTATRSARFLIEQYADKIVTYIKTGKP